MHSLFFSAIVLFSSLAIAQSSDFDTQFFSKIEGTIISKNNYLIQDSTMFFAENELQFRFFSEFNSRVGGGEKTVVLITLDKQGTWKAVKLVERYRINSYYKTKERERESKEEFSLLTSSEVAQLWKNLKNFGVLKVESLQRKKQVGNMISYISSNGHGVFYGLQIIRKGCTKSISFHQSDLTREEYKNDEDARCLKQIKELLEEI